MRTNPGAVTALVAGLLGVALPGCPEDDFQCAVSSSCGNGGQCEPSGYCSFPDVTCNSGRRYGDAAPPELANACVPVEVADTGSEGGGDDGADVGPATDEGPPATDEGPASTGADAGSEADDESGPIEPGCGNDVVEPGEECDGVDLGALPTCGDHDGYPPDAPVDCLDCEYRLLCEGYCNDGTLNSEWEQCDPSAVPPTGGNGCADIGPYTGGKLGCNPDCTFDETACTP